MVSHLFISHHFTHYLCVDMYSQIWTFCRCCCPYFMAVCSNLGSVWCTILLVIEFEKREASCV